MTISKLLIYVQKTNPEMTIEKLMEELSKCRYSAAILITMAQEFQKQGRK